MIETVEPTSEATQPAGIALRRRSGAERTALIAAVIGVYGLLALMLVFVMPGLFGFKTYTGFGQSMGETIPDGSLIVTRAVDADSIEVGDVIAFRWPNFDTTITHRVVEIRDRDGAPMFITRGDGNSARDPFPVFSDQQLRSVVFTTPYLGKYLPALRALIYVLAFAGGLILWRRHRARRLEAMRAMSAAGLSASAATGVRSDAERPDAAHPDDGRPDEARSEETR